MRDTAPPVAARALVIAQRLPHPVRGGGDLRVAQTVAAFADVGVVGLSAAEAPAGPPAGVGLWRAAESAPATTRDEAAASVAWLRDADGHPSDRWWTPQAAALVEGALREMDPEV